MHACRPPSQHRSLLAVFAATLCVGGLAACGSALRQGPIPHNLLEGAITAPYPVYWLGGRFDGMSISEVQRDPSEAFSVDYGGCSEGGEGACVPRLRLVSSPDNSFVPVGAIARRRSRIRDDQSLSVHGGKTIVIPIGGVILDIYAPSAAIASAAARTAVPINAVGAPEAPLPPARPNTGIGETPLPGQLPRGLAPAP